MKQIQSRDWMLSIRGNGLAALVAFFAAALGEAAAVSPPLSLLEKCCIVHSLHPKVSLSIVSAP
jgi:hypothetical protein